MDNEFKKKAKQNITDLFNKSDSTAWEELKEGVNRIPSVLRGESATPVQTEGLPSVGNADDEEELRRTLDQLRNVKSGLAVDPTAMQGFNADYDGYKGQMRDMDIQARTRALQDIVNKYKRPIK